MRRLLVRCLPFVFLFVLVAALAATTPSFRKPKNVADILRFSSMVIIMGVGMTFVIISAGIDLSVGSVLAFSGVIAAWCMRSGVPLGWSLAVGVATGTLWGLANGLLVIGLRLPPFVATLATMGIARGAAKLIARHITGLGTSVTVIDKGFAFVGNGEILGVIPVPIVVMAVVVVVGHYMLKHMRVGRYSFAIGSNVEAARYSGIPVSRYTLLVYVILGTLTAVAGMIQASINSGGIATTGEGYELHVIAAVVIGGASLSGGQGTVIGTVTGALIMAVIRNGCILNRVADEWQQVLVGALIIVAVAFDMFQRRRTGV